MIQGRGFFDILGGFTDHHPQFHFPIGFDRVSWNDDIIIWSADGTRGFGKNDRFRRHRSTGFFRMIRVVETDADEFADPGDTGAHPGRSLDGGQGARV